MHKKVIYFLTRFAQSYKCVPWVMFLLDLLGVRSSMESRVTFLAFNSWYRNGKIIQLEV